MPKVRSIIRLSLPPKVRSIVGFAGFLSKKSLRPTLENLLDHQNFEKTLQGVLIVGFRRYKKL